MVHQHIGILHRMKWEGLYAKVQKLTTKTVFLLNNMYAVISFLYWLCKYMYTYTHVWKIYGMIHTHTNVNSEWEWGEPF